MAAKIGIKADRIISPNSQPILIAALRTRGCGDCAVAGLGLLRRLSFLVLAAAQEILRQRDKSFDVALQFAAIFEGLLQLVEEIRGAQIKTAPRDAGRFFRRPQLAANRVKNFRRKKSDLAFVVVLEIEEPVADQTVACNALDIADF